MLEIGKGLQGPRKEQHDLQQKIFCHENELREQAEKSQIENGEADDRVSYTKLSIRTE